MADIGSGYTTTHPIGTKPKAPTGMPGTPNSGAQPLSFAPSSAPAATTVVSKEALFDERIGDLYRKARDLRNGIPDLKEHAPSPAALQAYMDRYAKARNAVAGRAALYGGGAAAGAAGVYGIGKLIANHMAQKQQAQPAPELEDTNHAESFEGG